MHRLLYNAQTLGSYFHDVLAHNRTWSEYMLALRGFFERVKLANLTLRPTKCVIRRFDISFLRHQLSEGGLKPKSDMVKKILEAPPWQTKKQLRAFRGLVEFYRKFVPVFAALTVLLMGLIQKGAPNEIVSVAAHDKAFEMLMVHIANFQILIVLLFSNIGLSAILLQ